MKIKSLLTPAPENLFQGIKRECGVAQEKGIDLIKLSIGQPSGPAPLTARKFVVRAIMSGKELMHKYQDNGSPGCPGFAISFVRAHKGNEVLPQSHCDNIAYLPIPGIKPMLSVVIDAMGGWERGCNPAKVATTCGYPTPAYMAKKAKYVIQMDLPFLAEQNFLPTVEDLYRMGLEYGDLIMLNLPNNPTGAVATYKWYEEICDFCQKKGIRLFNDAAYSVLRHDNSIPNLAEVACQYPELSWVEAYSASKAGNMTGWRIGAMVGSHDFIGDIAKVKGETDSGFNAALACGVLGLFREDYQAIEAIRWQYEHRMKKLVSTLNTECGLRPAAEPKAGFFTFFHAPKTVSGKSVPDAKEFNKLMINKTGLVGVPFGEYIRYAVCTVDVITEMGRIVDCFEKAKIGY